MVTKEVEIRAINFVKELYPRAKLDDETVSRYRTALDRLPPIVIAEKGMYLIDGYHRLVAHQVEGKTTIKAEILDIPKERIFFEAVKRNATHGKQLNNTEKKSIARKLYEEGDITQEEIADLLSVSQATVSRWTGDINHKRREEKKEKALKLYLDYLSYPTQEDIAKALKVSNQAISSWLSDSKNIQINNFRNPPESLQITTTWDFPQCDTQYGIEGYPGRMPGQVVENLLWYYTKPFDLVVDPMAGSGTTIDVCKKMLRRYAGFDINPIQEKGIRYNDITNGIPLKNNTCEFVLLDPPYWNEKKGEYSGDETNLVNMSLEDFLQAIEKILIETKRILKKGGKVAFIISGENKKETGFVDLGILCYKIVEKYFKVIERIAVIYRGASSHDAIWTHRAKENKFMFRGFRDLIIGEK